MTWPRLFQILFIALLCLLIPAPEAHCRPSAKDGLRFLSIDIQPKIITPNETVKVAVVYQLKGVADEGLTVTERKSLKFDGKEIALLENKQVRRTAGRWIVETTFLIPASAALGEYEILQVVFSNFFSRSIKGVFHVQEQQQTVAKRLERASEYAQQLKDEADEDLRQAKKAGEQKKVTTAPAVSQEEARTEVAIEAKPEASEPVQSVTINPEKATPEITAEQLVESGEVIERIVILPNKQKKRKKKVAEVTEPAQEAQSTVPEHEAPDPQEQVVKQQTPEQQVTQEKDKKETVEEPIVDNQQEQPEPSLSDEPQTPGSQTVGTVEQKSEEFGSVQPKEKTDSVEQEMKEKEPVETTDGAPGDDFQEKESTEPVTDLNIKNTVIIDDRTISRDDQFEQEQEGNMRLLKDAQEEIRLTRPDNTVATEKPIEQPSQAADQTDKQVVDPDKVFGDSIQPEGGEKKILEKVVPALSAGIAGETQPEADQNQFQLKEAESIKPLVAENIKQPISPVTVMEQTEQVQTNLLDQEKLVEQLDQQDETSQEDELIWPHNQDKIDPRVPEQARREKLKDGGYGPWMLNFPLGSFSMGGERDNEKPVHNVNIEQEFSIMIHEVTIGMYQEYQKSRYGDRIQPHEPWAEELPVTNISWRDAASFAIWLSQKSGKTYRLPTEAEWEYVAKICNRVEQTSPLLYQTDIEEDQDEQERVETVYNAESDLCKIYGLKGNVWEWTQDCWSERYTDGHNSQKAYSYPKCTNRVVRGGSYVEEKQKQSPTVRMGIDQKTKEPYIGFRLVRMGLM